MTRLWKILNGEMRGLHEAAYLLGFFALASQVLALLRDRLFAGAFGAGATLDAYFAAFRIPDLILISAASLVSASILIPFLVEKERDGKKEERQFIDALFSAFFLGIAALAAIAYIFAPRIVPLFFPGFSDGLSSDTILLTRIMLLQPILLGISNLFGSILQARGRFFVYAVSPLLYNFGIIFGVVLLYPTIGIAGLAWGVVFGAALHMLVQAPAVLSVGLLPRLTSSFPWSELKRVAILSLPRTASLGALNLASLVLLSIASSIGAGSIAIFSFAWNVQSVPLAIVGVSYSLAAFPTLVRLFAKKAANEFIAGVATAFRSIVFWSLPAAALFIVLRAQIVRVILGAGEFSWTDTRLTAAALAIFAVSLAAQSLSLLFLRAHYASGCTARPLIASAIAAAATVLFGFALAIAFARYQQFQFFMESLLRVPNVAGSKVLALPLAYSLGAFLHLALLWLFFAQNVRGLWRRVSRSVFENFAGAVLAGAAAYGGLNFFDNFFNLEKTAGIFLQGFLAGLLGIAVWVLALYLLKSRDLAEAWATLHRKVWRQKAISPDPSDAPTL